MLQCSVYLLTRTHLTCKYNSIAYSKQTCEICDVMITNSEWHITLADGNNNSTWIQQMGLLSTWRWSWSLRRKDLEDPTRKEPVKHRCSVNRVSLAPGWSFPLLPFSVGFASGTLLDTQLATLLVHSLTHSWLRFWCYPYVHSWLRFWYDTSSYNFSAENTQRRNL